MEEEKKRGKDINLDEQLSLYDTNSFEWEYLNFLKMALLFQLK